MDFLNVTDHRPWPMPDRSWVMAMQWHHLLFAHWPVAVEALRPLIPAELAIDTFDGEAWIGIVPFVMRNVHPRGVPSVPGLSSFPEINVRTYVTIGGKPGVWFFSLDAANTLAVALARARFHLPYFNADMACTVTAGEGVTYGSIRTHPGARAAAFNARYDATGEPAPAEPGTRDHWLTERYCLYAVDPQGKLLRADVHHRPWPLRPAKAEIAQNTMALAADIDLPDTPPLLHYAERLDVVAWGAEPVSGG
jgi:uncharacterized protein YqjF (DUF2071 family)